MNKLKVAIADDNVRIVGMLNTLICSEDDMEIVGTAVNGEETVDLIRRNSPDVLILDLIMPKMDGLSVMKQLNEDGHIKKKPDVIVVSAVGQEEVTEDAFALGADYYIMKPFSNDMLLDRLRRIIKKNAQLMNAETASGFPLCEGRDLETDVTNVLHEVGIPANIKGFQYLRDAIIMSVTDMEMVVSVTKVLYPAIAKKHQTTSSRVERAIRHAIEVAFTRGRLEILDDMFGYSVCCRKGKPTNSEFIAMIADRIRLEYRSKIT